MIRQKRPIHTCMYVYAEQHMAKEAYDTSKEAYDTSKRQKGPIHMCRHNICMYVYAEQHMHTSSRKVRKLPNVSAHMYRPLLT